MEWWRALLPLVWSHDEALSDIYDAVKHVEDSTNEVTRQAKGHGVPEAPDRLLVAKAKAACKKHGIRWPNFPDTKRSSA